MKKFITITHYPNTEFNYDFIFINSIDRCFPGKDLFNFKLQVETIPEINCLPETNKSFEEMCLERAEYFKSFDKKIFLQWSGGPDSSTAVVAFLKTWNDAELEKVFLCMNTISIDEYPKMWEILHKKFKNRIVSVYKSLPNYCEQGIVITGDLGGQIFGERSQVSIDSTFDNWKDFFFKKYKNKYGEKKANKILEKKEAAIEFCPHKIQHAWDFLWWDVFNVNWQYTKYKALLDNSWTEDNKIYYNNLISFYDTKEWQKWSILYGLFNSIKKNKSDSHKWAQKQFVSNYIKDYDFIKIKKILSDSFNITKKDTIGISLDNTLNKINISSTINNYINNEYYLL